MIVAICYSTRLACGWLRLDSQVIFHDAPYELRIAVEDVLCDGESFYCRRQRSRCASTNKLVSNRSFEMERWLQFQLFQRMGKVADELMHLLIIQSGVQDWMW